MSRSEALLPWRVASSCRYLNANRTPTPLATVYAPLVGLLQEAAKALEDEQRKVCDSASAAAHLSSPWPLYAYLIQRPRPSLIAISFRGYAHP